MLTQDEWLIHELRETGAKVTTMKQFGNNKAELQRTQLGQGMTCRRLVTEYSHFTAGPS